MSISRIFCILLFGIAASGFVRAQTGEEVTVDSLLSKQYADADAFWTAMDEAVEEGVNEQTVMEARLIYPFTSGQFDLFKRNLPLLEARAEEWDYGAGSVFREKDSLEGLMHAMKGYLALEGGDVETFKQQVGEVAWRDPAFLPVLGNWAQEFKDRQRMSSMRVSLDTKVSTSDGEVVSLKEVLGSNKALLMDFWATWCGPCMALMPELEKKAAELVDQGIVVAGMNTEDAEKAARIKSQRGIEFPWLVEAESGLSHLLRVDSIPRMVLIDGEGKVLFNGHPMDPKLMDAVAKVAPVAQE